MNNQEELWFWWFDQMIKLSLTYYFTPNFIIGNVDDWMKLGITMNGARPLCSN